MVRQFAIALISTLDSSSSADAARRRSARAGSRPTRHQRTRWVNVDVDGTPCLPRSWSSPSLSVSPSPRLVVASISSVRRGRRGRHVRDRDRARQYQRQPFDDATLRRARRGDARAVRPTRRTALPLAPAPTLGLIHATLVLVTHVTYTLRPRSCGRCAAVHAASRPLIPVRPRLLSGPRPAPRVVRRAASARSPGCPAVPIPVPPPAPRGATRDAPVAPTCWNSDKKTRRRSQIRLGLQSRRWGSACS